MAVRLKLSVEKIYLFLKKRATCFGLYNNHKVPVRKVLRQYGVYVTFNAKSYDRPNSPFHSKFSTDGDLVLPLSISRILSFL